MQNFSTASEIPSDWIVAPTSYCAPRPGAKCVGVFEGLELFRRSGVSELRTESEWLKLGRNVKPGQQPISHRDCPEPVATFAEWPTMSWRTKG
jgi:hypothetical protein